MSADRYYTELAAAFVRGKLQDTDGLSVSELIERGLESGLRLHKFKTNTELPRVKHVLGILRGLNPSTILDIGSGRGTFLWPLLAEHPTVEITSVDTRLQRVLDISAVRKGGIENLSVAQVDAGRLAFGDKSFDVTTVLEVLEHVQDAAQVAAEAVRATRQFVIASVPSREDTNPEHIRLFDRMTIEALFLGAGAARASVEYVRGHIIALARI